MRTALFLFGVTMVANPAFAQKASPSRPDAGKNATSVAKSEVSKTQRSGKADTKPVDAIQRRLDQEGERLQSQLAAFDKRREAALKVKDDAELKKIETQQKQLIANYEKRVEQVLANASKQKPAPPTAKSTARNTKQKRPAPRTTRPKRRGLRFWPFGR